MTEIRPISLRASGLNSDIKSPRPDKFDSLGALVLAMLAFCSFAFWWPTFATLARFAFLCCFPTVFPFCYALFRSPAGLREPRKRLALTVMALIHCTLLSGLVLAWIVYSTKATIGNPDVVFAFIAIEGAVMIMFARLGRPKAKE